MLSERLRKENGIFKALVPWMLNWGVMQGLIQRVGALESPPPSRKPENLYSLILKNSLILMHDAVAVPHKLLSPPTHTHHMKLYGGLNGIYTNSTHACSSCMSTLGNDQ